jgi:hypothetical protein
VLALLQMCVKPRKPTGRKAMISFSGSLKIFLLVDCRDMRKGFNGLYGLVSSSFGDDPEQRSALRLL